MTSVRSIFCRFRSAVALFGSAARVAGSLENRIAPNPRDLRRIGIDPKAFTTIGIG